MHEVQSALIQSEELQKFFQTPAISSAFQNFMQNGVIPAPDESAEIHNAFEIFATHIPGMRAVLDAGHSEASLPTQGMAHAKQVKDLCTLAKHHFDHASSLGEFPATERMLGDMKFTGRAYTENTTGNEGNKAAGNAGWKKSAQLGSKQAVQELHISLAANQKIPCFNCDVLTKPHFHCELCGAWRYSFYILNRLSCQMWSL